MLKLILGDNMDNELSSIYKTYQEKVETLWRLL